MTLNRVHTKTHKLQSARQISVHVICYSETVTGKSRSFKIFPSKWTEKVNKYIQKYSPPLQFFAHCLPWCQTLKLQPITVC